MRLIDCSKIKQSRKIKNLSQEDMANALQISRPSYIRIEAGLKDLTLNQLYKLIEVLDIKPQDLMISLRDFKEKDLDYEKLQQVIMACIQYGGGDDGKIPKTKLAKLVYLSDFNWFYQHKKSMTGAIYRAIQLGPVADDYFRAIDELFENQAITIEAKGNALLIGANESQKFDKLSRFEQSVIKVICKKWLGVRTERIVAFTHRQLPWKNTDLGDFIDYKHILKEIPSNLY